MSAEQASAEILIVDDDAGLAGTLRDFLIEQGYTAVLALSAPRPSLPSNRIPGSRLRSWTW